MATTHNESQSSLFTFVVGALTGIAAIMFLDKETRGRVEERLLEAKSAGEKGFEQAKRKVIDMADEKLSEAHELLEDQKPATRINGSRKKTS